MLAGITSYKRHPSKVIFRSSRPAAIPKVRSAAPASISRGATTLVFGTGGHETAVQDTDRFTSQLDRYWMSSESLPLRLLWLSNRQAFQLQMQTIRPCERGRIQTNVTQSSNFYFHFANVVAAFRHFFDWLMPLVNKSVLLRSGSSLGPRHQCGGRRLRG
jgi:hypothetical protein